MRLCSIALVAISFGFLGSREIYGDELLWKYNFGRPWKMTEQRSIIFTQFLNQERTKLLSLLPALNFPDQFASPQDGITYLFAGDKNYKNREVSCQFIQKLFNTLPRDSKQYNELMRITQNGSICIPGDLPPESSKDNWVLSMVDVIWNGTWLEKKHQKISLKDWIVDNFPKETKQIAPRLQFKMIEGNDALDSYGYSSSTKETNFIYANASLKRIYNITKNFNPNFPETTFGDLGTEIGEKIKSKPFYYGEPFITEPSVYISNNWQPDWLPELLTHEFGHVFQISYDKNNRFHKDKDAIVYHEDRTQFEGFAETFAWLNLQDVYKKYPELEVLHIIKLKFQTQFNPADPHLVGTGATCDLFSICTVNNKDSSKKMTSSQKYFHDFLRANDFDLLLKQHDLQTAVSQGDERIESVKLIFK